METNKQSFGEKGGNGGEEGFCMVEMQKAEVREVLHSGEVRKRDCESFCTVGECADEIVRVLHGGNAKSGSVEVFAWRKCKGGFLMRMENVWMAAGWFLVVFVRENVRKM